MRTRRHNRRVQFLPSLPPNDILGWVSSQATQGQNLAPGSAKSSLVSPSGNRHPTGGGEGNLPKKRRQDFPVLRTGRSQPSHADADDLCPDQMRGALKDLVDDMYASSSRAPRDALLRTWSKFHRQWYGPEVDVLPITEDKLLKVSSLFKKGGYKSVKNYLSRIKEHHITSGYVWGDRLDIFSKKCARSVLRGLGGSQRSEPFDLLAVSEVLGDTTDPLVRQGPVNPLAMIVTATMFMLRDLKSRTSPSRRMLYLSGYRSQRSIGRQRVVLGPGIASAIVSCRVWYTHSWSTSGSSGTM